MNNYGILKSMHEIIDKLNKWSHEYYDLDSPTVSDKEYDKAFDYLVSLEKSSGIILSNSPTQNVGGSVIDTFKKVKHSIPMLSSDKSTDIEVIEKFISSPVVGSYKLDGSTVVLKYNNCELIQALTRGNGKEGEDITHTAKTIKNIPLHINDPRYLEIRGEALISWEDYNAMNKSGELGHPRNVASGALRQLDANFAKDKQIRFYAFTLVNWEDFANVSTKMKSLELLEYLGFETVPHCLVKSSREVKSFIEKFNRETYDNPTDGWVFEYDDLKYGKSLGSTSHHDRKMIALKPEAYTVETTFRGIEYNVSRNGMVSLTAHFAPIEIDNTTVTKASVHNVDIFNSFEFGVGDVITVYKANMIIPQIDDNLDRSGTYKLIDKCPICGKPLEIRMTANTHNLFCTNEKCPAKILAQFTHFVEKDAMDIDGLSESTLEKLILIGAVRRFKDLYHLEDYTNDILTMEGFGKKKFTNLTEAIDKSRHTTLDRFLVAMGIPNIGVSASKVIAKAFNGSYRDFITCGKDFDFTTLEDFGEVVNNSIHEWLNAENSLADGLAEELTFEEFTSVANDKTNNDFINGKTFVVTGKFETMTRTQIEELITSNGGKLGSSVSKNTSYLLTNDTTTGTSKNKKAKELGIPIMTEKEFLSNL